VQPLLDVDAPVSDPARADCAAFYSITNCQSGLRGVSFGNFLIKQAVEDLGREFRRLRIFATLSPIPGFVAWLTTAAAGSRRSPPLNDVLGHAGKAETLLQKDVPERLRREVIELAAQYLLNAKRGAEALDPVARFHLANGARLERLNWMGDTSETGLRQALGLTANYVYRLAEVERNHESYAKTGRIVTTREIEALTKRLSTPASRSR
jgi:malonyl-CoA decarboxylase